MSFSVGDRIRIKSTRHGHHGCTGAVDSLCAAPGWFRVRLDIGVSVDVYLMDLEAIATQAQAQPMCTAQHTAGWYYAQTGDFGTDDENMITVTLDPCAWCGKPAICLPCQKYETAWRERLAAGGTHDCAEEREALKRWVDSR